MLELLLKPIEEAALKLKLEPAPLPVVKLKLALELTSNVPALCTYAAFTDKLVLVNDTVDALTDTV
jgi:hypothetical protein